MIDASKCASKQIPVPHNPNMTVAYPGCFHNLFHHPSFGCRSTVPINMTSLGRTFVRFGTKLATIASRYLSVTLVDRYALYADPWRDV